VRQEVEARVKIRRFPGSAVKRSFGGHGAPRHRGELPTQPGGHDAGPAAVFLMPRRGRRKPMAGSFCARQLPDVGAKRPSPWRYDGSGTIEQGGRRVVAVCSFTMEPKPSPDAREDDLWDGRFRLDAPSTAIVRGPAVIRLPSGHEGRVVIVSIDPRVPCTGFFVGVASPRLEHFRRGGPSRR
jgi:hypothetical protein